MAKQTTKNGDVSLVSYLSRLAQQEAPAADLKLVQEIREEAEKKQRDQVKARIQLMVNDLNNAVAQLREVRRKEKMWLKSIEQIEQRGELILQGKSDEEIREIQKTNSPW